METHTETQSHQCSDCGKLFKKACNLKIHMMMHTGEKPHACSLCNKKFVRRLHLFNHMRSHTGEKPPHTGEKPHQCSVCRKQFKHLSLHMLIHTVRTEKCPPLAASSNQSMFGEVHECPLCHQKYTTKGVLNQHMIIHRGEKSHPCTMCSERFTLRETLDRHMEAHARGDLYKCSECKQEFINISDLRMHMNFGKFCTLPSDSDTQVSDNADGIAAILTQGSEDNTSTLVHQSTMQIYQTLMEMLDEPGHDNTQFGDHPEGISGEVETSGIPIIVQPETTTSAFNDYQHVTIPTAHEEERMYSSIPQTFKSDRNPQNSSENGSPSQGVGKMTNGIIDSPELNDVEQIPHIKTIPMATEYHLNQFDLLRSNLRKEVQTTDSCRGDDSFDANRNPNVQTIKTKQVGDMVEDYSSYMDNIDYSSCDICVRGFFRPIELDEHLERHLEEHVLLELEGRGLAGVGAENVKADV